MDRAPFDDAQNTPAALDEEDVVLEQEDDFFFDTTPKPRYTRLLFFIASVAIIGSFLVFFLNITSLNIDISILSASGNVTKQSIASYLGLGGKNYFQINIDDIKRKLENHDDLRFISADKVFPNQLFITVQERIPIGLINFSNRSYIICDDGHIWGAERTRGKTLQGVRVEGVDLISYRAGITPIPKDQEQLNLAVLLLKELVDQSFYDAVDSIDVSESINLRIITKDGYHIRIGDSKYLSAKIGTVKAVVKQMQKLKLGEGIIEATIPGEAIYRPIE